MKHLAGAIVSVLLALPVSAQSPGLAQARKDMNTAAARQDKVAFASFLSNDLTSVDSAGKLRDKAAAIEDMPPGNAQTNAEVNAYGDGAVVAIGYNPSGESPARIIQVDVDTNWSVTSAAHPGASPDRAAISMTSRAFCKGRDETV
jgi:hypothetical protein